MPAKVIPCALCQDEAAAVFCVNDDAHLCVSCDATVHANNPLLARHERRPLNALTLQAESAAHNASSAPSTLTDGDVAVVPQLGGGGADAQPAVLSPLDPSPAPAPLTLYEDSFFSRALSASDLLDLDSDELELPGGANPFAFDPMHDAVVPSFGKQLRPIGAPRWGQTPALPQQTSFMSQQRYAPYVPQQHMVPMGAAKPMPRVRTPEEEAEEAARVARHRERQRKKRNFGRTVRYQSRRAYAEIRPRIKGRFVTPEEYAAYQAQQAAQKAGGDKAMPAPASYAEPAAPLEEDAVVPVPSFA